MTGFEPMVLIRILCGIWFLPHCIGKIRNIGMASVTFEKAGFRPGRVWVTVTVVLEVLAGIGLVFGIYERIAAGLAVIVLAGASYAVVKINGFNWRWQKQGPEYMLFWAAMCMLSVI